MSSSRASRSDERFTLVTAGHQFLLQVLPFRDPESRQALDTFIHRTRHTLLPAADIDAVLLRILAVLDRHTGGRLPTLVERYASTGPAFTESVPLFSTCVLDVLRFRGIDDGAVQQAIDLIGSAYSTPKLRPASIAQRLGVRLATLCVAFKRSTGVTLGSYLRSVRLDQAALLLTTTNKTIKETWVQVGYTYASNFDHDFKARFGATPSAYRAHALLPVAQARQRAPVTAARLCPDRRDTARPAQTVLIVDDDELTKAMVGAYLGRHGMMVDTACGAAEGLDKVERLTPDVLLLDYRLNGIDGLAFLRAMQARGLAGGSGVRAPAVALFTADWDVFDRVEEVQALNARIVSKLIDLEQLAEIVVQLATADGDRPPAIPPPLCARHATD